MRSRFLGQLHALANDGGAEYENHQRFCPLHGDGKPLWEFKEHDHRLYCVRLVRQTGVVDIVLLSGWIKDKKGKSKEESREIEKAMSLYNDFMAEYPGGGI